MAVEGLNMGFGSDEDVDGVTELRQIGDRLPPDSWHIDAILPPDASEMVYEDLQPVAAAMQGSGNHVCYTTATQCQGVSRHRNTPSFSFNRPYMSECVCQTDVSCLLVGVPSLVLYYR